MRRSLAVLIVSLGGVAASAATAGEQAPGTAGSYVTEMPSVSSFDAQRGALPTTGAQPRLGAQIDKPGSGLPGARRRAGACRPDACARPVTATPGAAASAVSSSSGAA